jgi:short subunit fatty acids transporter
VNLASAPVLGLAAVAASPALYQGFVTGALPLDTTLIRYLVAVVVVWVGLSLMAMLIAPSPSSAVRLDPPAPVDPTAPDSPGPA